MRLGLIRIFMFIHLCFVVTYSFRAVCLGRICLEEEVERTRKNWAPAATIRGGRGGQYAEEMRTSPLALRIGTIQYWYSPIIINTICQGFEMLSAATGPALCQLELPV